MVDGRTQERSRSRTTTGTGARDCEELCSQPGVSMKNTYFLFPVIAATLALLVAAVIIAFGAQDVSAARPYEIRDATKADEGISFWWTRKDKHMDVAWQAIVECEGEDPKTVDVTAGQVPADGGVFVGGFPFANDKACTYRFLAPKGATDWKQFIYDKDNNVTHTYAGNIKQDSPWRFEELALLPAIETRIPDLVAVEGSDLTIFAAVNLELYMTENPKGFLDGAWEVGQTLSDLGVEIVNGEVAGVQGIYWATTDFEFDSDPPGGGSHLSEATPTFWTVPPMDTRSRSSSSTSIRALPWAGRPNSSSAGRTRLQRTQSRLATPRCPSPRPPVAC